MGTQKVDVQLHEKVLVGAIEGYNCGTVPTVFAPTPVWRDAQERAFLKSEVDRILTEAELLNDGLLVHSFEDALHTIGRPDVALYGWLQQRGKNDLALFVGRNGHDAVVAAKGGNQVVILGADYRTVALTMNNELPTGQPGRGRSFTFPESEGPWNWVNEDGRLPDGSHARPDAVKAADIIMAPLEAAAQIYGLINGEKSPTKLVVMWVQDYGIWTVRTQLDGRADPFVTVAPASDDSLTGALEELITE